MNAEPNPLGSYAHIPYTIFTRGYPMTTIQKNTLGTVIIIMLVFLTGCSSMSTRDKNTAIGAGIGAVGGSVITGGSTAGALGGAAIGGLIGHEANY